MTNNEVISSPQSCLSCTAQPPSSSPPSGPFRPAQSMQSDQDNCCGNSPSDCQVGSDRIAPSENRHAELHSLPITASAIPRAFLPTSSTMQVQPNRDNEPKDPHLTKEMQQLNESNYIAYRERVLRKGIIYIQSQEHMSSDQKSQNIQRLMCSNKWTPTFDSVIDLTSIINKVIESESAIQTTQYPASPHSRVAAWERDDNSSIIDCKTGSFEAEDGLRNNTGYGRHRYAVPTVTDADKAPTFTDSTQKHFGCPHYQRGCKLFASCCGKWATCHICHEIEQDHAMNRTNIDYIMCMTCSHVQQPAQECSECHTSFSTYFCPTCKLWESNEQKQIFHCNDCGICRVGGRSNFIHCNKCNCCLSRAYSTQHRCIERNLECDCPICGDYLFTSMYPVMFMQCGHAIHTACFYKMELRSTHQCPICQKSVRDMKWLHSRLDAVLEAQQMPEEYSRDKSLILCNDCEKRSQTKYHFLYHKCTHCTSYNTKVIEIIKGT